jgi:HD-GYP domain-containing protein (c-di-GMP phosphodiesterase class II)
MKLIPLSQVSSSLHAGVTLPWGVRDANGTLLLAKGHVLPDDKSVQSLLDRGMYVDAAEAAAAKRQEPAKEESMTTRWGGLEARLGTLLKSVTDPFFLERVDEAIDTIAPLADGNVDLLIFMILRHDHSRPLNYGTVHSLHTASICSLLSRRKGWAEPQRRSIIGAALTMNISMLDLQGSLAVRSGRPTEPERGLIDKHPSIAADLLRAAGLTDTDWLAAVEQHHEITGGTGYPNKVAEPTEMARMLRFVDTFMAKHSPRAGRKTQPAHQAARDLFTHSGGDPLAGLIIKEFGIYPPGAYVKLASGEVAIVTQRGAAANSPIVMAITNKTGDPLSLPSQRDTSLVGTKIVATVEEELIRVRHSAERLYDRNANR